MEELLLKSLNCTKAPGNDITMYSTIETFEYVPENDKTFHAFYRRYKDVFNVDCKEWSNEKKVRLLLRKLCTTEHSRFVDFILPKKQWIWSSQKQLNYYLIRLVFDKLIPRQARFKKTVTLIKNVTPEAKSIFSNL